MIVDLFATSLNYRLPMYFSPLNDPVVAGTDAFLQSWDGLQTYAFTVQALVQQEYSPHLGGPPLATKGVVPRAPEPCSSNSGRPATESQSSQTATCTVHCLHQNLHMLHLHAWRLQRFARHLGLSGRGSSAVIVSSLLLAQVVPASVGMLSPLVF